MTSASPEPSTAPGERILVDAGTDTATVTLDGELVAITASAVVLREVGYPPRIYLPVHDVRVPLIPSDRTTVCPWKGTATYHHLAVGGRQVDNAAWCYAHPFDYLERIAGLVAFDDRFVVVVG